MPTPSKTRSMRALKKRLAEIHQILAKDGAAPSFLQWREETETTLRNIFGASSPNMQKFEAIQFNASAFDFMNWDEFVRADDQAKDWGLERAATLLSILINQVEDLWEDGHPSSDSESETQHSHTNGNAKVFLIHGRDHGARDTVARFLEGLDIQPTILEDAPNRGRTIIEKFEQSTDTDFAIALFTPDDTAGKTKENLKPRARQNVVLEYGYYLGRFGRARVCALVKGDVELPSDISGVLYVSLDDSGGWKNKLANELKDAGFSFDAARLLSS